MEFRSRYVCTIMSACWHPSVGKHIGDLLAGPIALVDKFEQLQQQCTDLDAESSDKQESHACQARDLTATQIAIPSPSEAPDKDGEFCSIAIRIQEGMQQNEQAAEGGLELPFDSWLKQSLIFKAARGTCKFTIKRVQRLILTPSSLEIEALSSETHPNPGAAMRSGTCESLTEGEIPGFFDSSGASCDCSRASLLSQSTDYAWH